jgi:hypothetical protein
MTEPAVVLDLYLELSQEEATRYLGYPRGRSASTNARERLETLWPEAIATLSPRGAYALVGRPEAVKIGMPEPADLVGIAVCTIGTALEQESERRAAGTALLDALVLDAIGSAAAEAAADALNLEICSVATQRGLEAAPRVSPGYGSWDTSCQVSLLGLLPIEKIGVRLTSGAMMLPRKSVSFAVGLVPPGAMTGHAAARCSRCGLLRCRHRMAPYEDT